MKDLIQAVLTCQGKIAAVGAAYYAPSADVRGRYVRGAGLTLIPAAIVETLADAILTVRGVILDTFGEGAMISVEHMSALDNAWPGAPCALMAASAYVGLACDSITVSGDIATECEDAFKTEMLCALTTLHQGASCLGVSIGPWLAKAAGKQVA